MPLREKLEAKPRDDICQRAAHLSLGWATSVQTGMRGGDVCARELTFNFLNLHSTLIVPASFLHYCPFSQCSYVTLSDNTLGAILELISLIGNKLQLFLQLETAFLSYYKQ